MAIVCLHSDDLYEKGTLVTKFVKKGLKVFFPVILSLVGEGAPLSDHPSE